LGLPEEESVGKGGAVISSDSKSAEEGVTQDMDDRDRNTRW